jgi:hypothetical protein
MRELSDAIARGALARVSILRDERQTRDAQRLLDDLSSPVDGLGGGLPANPERYSPQEVLREQAELERAFLAMRQERRQAFDQARETLSKIAARIGPSCRQPYLDGEVRIAFLSILAVAFSAAGDESQAIRISEFLLAKIGAPGDLDQLAEYVRETHEGRRNQSRIVIQLQNLAVRRMTLAYLAALGGERDEAVELLSRARTEARLGLELRPGGDGPRAVSARLLSRSTLAHIEFELAVLVEDATERSASLTDVRERIVAVVTDSFATSAVRPQSRLIRTADLGMVNAEQARLRAAEGDSAGASALAWVARALLQPYLDIFDDDADEAPAKAIRYGEACRLSDNPRQAQATWRRSRDRLALHRGEQAPTVAALDALIHSLRSA